jgi:ubiquinone/menaquinone biosynthesis C-methylase UbiE
MGCGAGQTLIAAGLPQMAFGVDFDEDALRLGQSLTDRIAFILARAEALPLQESTFDLAIARVSLPYTNIPESLRELRRVLKPGGRLWITLHPFRVPWRKFLRQEDSWKGWIYFVYILANSLLLHLAGRQIRYLGRRCESFQTKGGMRRALERAGFGNIQMSHDGEHFLITAKRRESIGAIRADQLTERR